MKMSFARKPFSLIFLLALLLISQGRAYGYVWCFGEDGHTRIEQSASGESCGDDQKPGGAARWLAASITTVLSASDQHCGPCLDLPAYLNGLQNRIQGHNDLAAQPLPPALMQAPIVSPFVRILTANLIPNPPPRPDSILLVLRTVVLLN